MVDSNSNNRGKDIWSQISLDVLVNAIASLGNRTEQLHNESWRFSVTIKPSISCWSQIIDELKLSDSEKTRQSLYKIWRSNRHNIRDLVEKRKKEIKSDGIGKDVDDGIEVKESVVAKKMVSALSSEPSLPLLEPPNTRSYQMGNTIGKFMKYRLIKQELISLTRSEWKSAFCRTDKKTKVGWTEIFNRKLHSLGILHVHYIFIRLT